MNEAQPRREEISAPALTPFKRTETDLSSPMAETIRQRQAGSERQEKLLTGLMKSTTVQIHGGPGK